MRFSKSLLTLSFLTLITGCVEVTKIPKESLDYPYNSYQERYEAEKAEERRQEERRQQRISEYYRDNQYGSKVSCTVQGGEFDFKPGWRRYRSFAFTLVPTESKAIRVYDEKGKKNNDIWVSLDESGQSVMFCPKQPTSSYRFQDCRSITGTYNDFTRGLTRGLTAREIISGATVNCSYAGGRGAPGIILMP